MVWSQNKIFSLNLYSAKSDVISFWVGVSVGQSVGWVNGWFVENVFSPNFYQAKSGVIPFLWEGG